MLSRVAAVKAPRTHNRRRMTGSSGRRREGGESEPQRPNMSRHVFSFAVLHLFVVLVMCCRGAASSEMETAVVEPTSPMPSPKVLIDAGGSVSEREQPLQRVDLFVPNQTLVLPKGGTSPETTRDSFVSPSLVSAGGVIAAFAAGHMDFKRPTDASIKPSFGVVAGYMNSAWNWSALVAEVNNSTWKAHTVLGTADTEVRVGGLFNPTTTTKGNKFFLLAGSSDAQKEGLEWKWDSLELKLVVGDVTKPTVSEPSQRIEWTESTSLWSQVSVRTHERQFRGALPSGGSGVLMEDDTLVFSLMAGDKSGNIYSMIIYSTNNGSTWALSKGVSPAGCRYPRITEWEGSLLMIVDCENGQRVYESRDMGTTWTEAIGGLLGVWVNARSGGSWDESLRVGALITATIEERRVMLYTQRGNFWKGQTEMFNALYLWVTDNNRSFHVGPVAMYNNKNWDLASNLLYSDGNLHLLQRSINGEGSAISLSRLTEELSTVKSVLSTWAKKDIFFSNLSIPTAGLVAVLSDAASNDTWNDEYLCLNATVTNAKKVKDGVQLTEPNSGVIWSLNTRDNNVRHVFLNHSFTLVATVSIQKVPSKNASLLAAALGDAGVAHFMILSYTTDKRWETMFEGQTTTQSGRWEPKKEYQVALMLQGQKVSVYIDGQLLGEEGVLFTNKTPLEFVDLCFGVCGEENPSQESHVTVTNVFLHNRPLNSTEMRAIKDRTPVPKRDPESQVEGGTERRHIPRIEGVRANAPAGSGLLPLLLLLGLWGFAAA
ncbi:trans-sialidase, putative [Trypanosoma cruzi]|uniref:Trans-sialidase, putative n=1 Tax=Trypanosoma cruzi (strain CL Brener) TaxID=353153 RepID=Q4CRR3_TRYCC|nr:trans-sialidase, putative [Trypanosoma cruzi]EAN82966.1 trans-sialidase, putative [Trypanosoma cruzi]|eukprot:XP_804817.1 trans-sialidase [Trypanosoma cruzi strain CL Brener]